MKHKAAVTAANHGPEREEAGAAVRDRIVAFIEAYSAAEGHAPSYQEMAGAMGLASISTVHHHLEVLEQAGRISRTPGMPRSVTVRKGRRRLRGLVGKQVVMVAVWGEGSEE